MIDRLRTAITNLVSRAVLRLVNDDAKMQILQIELLRGELRIGERFQQYGFTAHPHPGAESVVLFPGGMRDHCLIIAVDDRRYRLKGLAEGEVALYTDEGDYVHLKRGNIIEVKAETKVVLDTPLTEIKGDVTVDGDVTATGDVTADGISLKTHVHGGVQTGGGTTGAPE